MTILIELICYTQGISDHALARLMPAAAPRGGLCGSIHFTDEVTEGKYQELAQSLKRSKWVRTMMFDSEVPALIYSLSEFTGDSREERLLSCFTIFFVIREFLVSVTSQCTRVLFQDLLCVCVYK